MEEQIAEGNETNKLATLRMISKKQPKEDGSLVRNTLFLSVQFHIPKSLIVSSPN